MARARNIKPGLFDNERLAECPPLARLIFIGLWMLADRAGRLEDRPKRIKAQLLPYDDCDPDELLQSLAERGFIVRYQVNGDSFIWIPAFSKHQKPHANEKESVIPPYVEACSAKVASDSDQGSNDLALNDERGKMNDEPTGGGEVSRFGPVTRPEMIPIPKPVDTPEFRAVWFDEWVPYLTRKANGRCPDQATLMAQLTTCARAGPQRAIKAIRESIHHGWLMLKDPSETGTKNAATGKTKQLLGK